MFPNPKRAGVYLSFYGCASLVAALSCSSGGSDLRPPTEPAQLDPNAAGAGDQAASSGNSGNAEGGRGTLGTTGGAAPGDDGAGAPQGGAIPAAGGASADAGGAIADAGAAGAAATEPTPADTTCTGQRAFVVSSGAFIAPTSKPLAEALNDDIYGLSPITFVLLNDSVPPLVAASYTEEIANKQAFHSGIAPDKAEGWSSAGAFGTDTAQPVGYLLVDTDDGPLEVPLANLAYTITTSEDCTQGVATLAAVIPAERADVVDLLTGVSSDDPDDPGRPESTDTPVSAIFAVDLADFDFGSLP